MNDFVLQMCFGFILFMMVVIACLLYYLIYKLCVYNMRSINLLHDRLSNLENIILNDPKTDGEVQEETPEITNKVKDEIKDEDVDVELVKLPHEKTSKELWSNLGKSYECEVHLSDAEPHELNNHIVYVDEYELEHHLVSPYMFKQELYYKGVSRGDITVYEVTHDSSGRTTSRKPVLRTKMVKKEMEEMENADKGSFIFQPD